MSYEPSVVLYTDDNADPFTGICGVKTFFKRDTAENMYSNNSITAPSLTSTGDLTVDTNTLKVDSTNNKVGILNASPQYALDVAGDVNLSEGSLYRINGVPISSTGNNAVYWKATYPNGDGWTKPTTSSIVAGKTSTVSEYPAGQWSNTYGGYVVPTSGVYNISFTVRLTDTTAVAGFKPAIMNPADSTYTPLLGFFDTNMFMVSTDGSGNRRISTYTTTSFVTAGYCILAYPFSASNVWNNYECSGYLVTDDVPLSLLPITLDAPNTRVGINKTTPAYTLDVTGNANVSGTYKIAGTDVISYNTGTTTLGGTNVYFPSVENDYPCTLQPRTGGAAAVLQNINSTGIYCYVLQNNQTEEMSFTCQLDHMWEEGTSITPHLHWCPTNTNTNPVLFTLTYSISNIGEVWPSTETIEVNPTPSGVAYKHGLTNFPSITMTSKTYSCVFVAVLKRPSTDGRDTFTGDAVIMSLDLHARRNRMGYNS